MPCPFARGTMRCSSDSTCGSACSVPVKNGMLTVAIVGAGPSGIEMAATLADLLPNWDDRLGGDSREIRIAVFNRSQEILSGDINSHLREIAIAALQARSIPVELVLGASVKAVSAQAIEYDRSGLSQVLQTATVIWTAGTLVHPAIAALEISPTMRDRSGRLKVIPTKQLPEFPEVFVAHNPGAAHRTPIGSPAHQGGFLS